MQLACIFPGQGSQSLGMLQSVYNVCDSISKTFLEAQEVLGIDYWNMISQGSEQTINDTSNTQLIMLIADVAMYRFHLKNGMPQPKYMAGHSLGEYAALVASESISFKDALHLVQHRARLMQQAVVGVEGAMAAIVGLENSVVEQVCKELSRQYSNMFLSAANYNAPGQVVIAGHKQMVVMAIEKFEDLNARMAKLIPVSVPCHCDLMKPAVDEFSLILQNTPIQLPLVPVISNVNACVYKDVADIKRLLAEQLFKPVLWVETLQFLEKNGVNVLMECGPGKVLTGLAKRTVPGLKGLFCFEDQHKPEWELVS